MEPTSEQPSAQTNGRLSDGTPVGRQQRYDVPDAGGGTEAKLFWYPVIRGEITQEWLGLGQAP